MVEWQIILLMAALDFVVDVVMTPRSLIQLNIAIDYCIRNFPQSTYLALQQLFCVDLFVLLSETSGGHRAVYCFELREIGQRLLAFEFITQGLNFLATLCDLLCDPCKREGALPGLATGNPLFSCVALKIANEL